MNELVNFGMIKIRMNLSKPISRRTKDTRSIGNGMVVYCNRSVCIFVLLIFMFAKRDCFSEATQYKAILIKQSTYTAF